MNNTFITALENTFNYNLTENMAIALKSTGSKVYDLFAFGAAYRNRSEEDCILLFKEAFEEDPNLAMKCLFYIRDCRGGQGERRFFRVCYKWLADNDPAGYTNLIHVSEYGRWDDLLCLLDTKLKKEVCSIIKDQLMLDMEDAIDNKAISLLGKWLPSENAHSSQTKRYGRIIRNYLNMTPKQYRQMLSKLRKHLNVLERLMSSGEWNKIEFDKIPSKAGLVYRNAFARRDMIAEKYKNFSKEGNKVNADTLYPYEVVREVTKKVNFWSNFDDKKFSETDRAMINKYWDNLKDYFNGANASILCVVDTSGSMATARYNNVAPIDVAISLGLYCAEHMTGPFGGKYISFASCPQLIKTRGVDFVDKVARIYKTNLVDNTNLTAVFDLLLNTAKQKNVKVEDIPKTIVVISDMEIDYQSDWESDTAITEMDKIREEWEANGYELPKLVYWNVNARNDTILDSGPNVSFVSGCSPVIFESVLTGKQGVELMMEVLMKERYKDIEA